MERARMMLNSILHEKSKIDRSILIRYYINEYKSSNPIFLFQFFKLVLKHIYENEDFDTLDLLIDNFHDEICMYGHMATNEFNKLLSHFVSSGRVSYVVKVSSLVPEIGDKTSLKIMRKFLLSLEGAKYIDPREIFTVKKAIYDLDNRLNSTKDKTTIDILDQGITMKWKKFEHLG